jgi:phage gp46-like protein
MSDLRLDTPHLIFERTGTYLIGQWYYFAGTSESHDERSGGDLTFDWTHCYGQFTLDHGLRTAVMLSLFCDARAQDGDELPDAEGGGPFPDRRGYWADYLSSLGPSDRWGSRLWILRGQGLTQGVLARARTYALEALEWIVAQGIGTVEVETSREGRDRMLIDVTVTDAIGRASKRWRFAWEAMIEGGV